MARILAVLWCIGFSQVVRADMADGERLYKEGSYQLAREAFAKVDPGVLDAEERRWREFRLAETMARSQAASQQPDDSAVRQAETDLRKFIEEGATVDRLWAETQETFGDLQRGSRRMDLGGAWSFYEKALDYWGGSTNLTFAAEKYWSILRKAAEPTRIEPMWYYGSFGTYIPLPVLENALKIARNDEERARAHFMIAMTLRSQAGEWEQRFRIPKEFDEAMTLKKDTRWYDDALYFYGEWMSSNGRAVQDEGGNWRTEPDYQKALELFRRIVAEFRKGETPWFDDAQNRIREIIRPEVQLAVGNVFLPQSEIEFHVSWRNVESIDFTLLKVDLTEDFSLRNDNTDWLQGLNANRGEKVKSWTKTIEKKKPYAPGDDTVRLEEKLPSGAYVILAKSGNVTSREMLLVTDASLVLQTVGRKTVVYACDSGTGAPLASAKVVLWERYYDGKDWRWIKYSKTADEQGLARIDLKGGQSQSQLYATIKSGARQAFSSGGNYYYAPDRPGAWKIYAFPDKPAYRPGEKVQWKIIARTQNGEIYTVPSGEKLIMRLTDPRGAEVSKETLTLNNFGSAWGAFDLKSELPLGEYQAIFLDPKGDRQIRAATLFRLEEYKLPEFKVAIKTPDENGRKKTFLLGETVEVEISADYYFGGPVANATVEVVVHQAPYYHVFTEPHEFEWYYSERSRPYRGYDPGQVVQRETVKTDANGKAKIKIKTPLGGGSDLEYRIEARITDASRREITGTDKIRVGMQRFYVHPKAAHHLYRPQDKVEVEFRAVDANEQPIAAEGTVRVTRDYWFEVWLAPDGREVKGGELQVLQKAGNFPPPPQPGQKSWRLKFRGYQQDQILTRTVKSDTNGVAALTFTPEREGYYRIAWRTDEQIKEGQIPSRPIRAETTVWVATTQSADLGYRTGGLEILADRDTFRAGQKASVMLSAPTNDRYVLLTTAGADLLDYQLVHLTGSVKLIQLAIDEKHVPNFFINGVMVADQQFFTEQKEIVVPPTKNFLTVEVESDRSEYRPGEKGTLHVRTRNDEGQPVPTEIALTVFDESLSYIQADTSGDPRQFFFGQKRPMLLNSSSSFNYRPYQKIVDKEDDQLAQDKDERGFGDRYNFRDGKVKSFGLQGGAAPARYDGSRPEAMLRAAKSLDTVMLSEALAAPGQATALGLAMNAAEPEAAVQVRTDFRSAIFWEPDVRTDANGRAEVSFTYPDSLTSWKAVARAVTTGNQFGIDDATTRTKQPLIVRLQAPRFFLVGDTVTVSAVINNNTAETLTVTPQIDAAGMELENAARSPVSVRAGGEARVDWTVHPRKPGEIKLKVTGRGGRFSDAMEKSFTVYEHGIDKFLAVSGKSREDKTVATLDIPAERKAGSTKFTVQVTPSLAVTMLDALPYLIEYPYGCTEQTMSRFLPAAITAKTLKDLGLAPEDVMSRVFGGIEEANAAKTHPAGKKNLDKLTDITEKGLTRLYQFQHGDGGWGWWKEGDSDHFMTAYVVWGLSLAKAAGTKIDANVLDRAVAFLNQALINAEREYDLQAFMLHALAEDHRNLTTEQQTAFDNLWEHRDQLNAYSRALFALAAHNFQKKTEAETLIRNLGNGARRDNAPGQTILGKVVSQGSTMPIAHWGEDGLHWRWSEGGVEATAFGLRALLAIDPKNELIDPVANWLIKNRRGAQWSNTRDSAIVLLALNDYLRVTGEIKGELRYELFVNGSSLGTRKISGPDIFNAPEKFTVPENLIKDGANEIRIERKSGESPIYFAAECSFFSLEEPITPAGNEIFVRRRYYKLAPVATLLKGYIYKKQELSPGDKIASGERIETILTIEAKNNYEYLLFEDLKPAGVEAVEIRSGESLYASRIRSSSITNVVQVASNEPIVRNNRSLDQTGETRWVYQELRDRKVALFIDKLPEGFWEIRYETRAEIPGEFHALPVVGHAMYVPEIRGNSAESKIIIVDAKESHE
jgi:uncharacterized protein YfaS (alpha-2-macroglobulin family)